MITKPNKYNAETLLAKYDEYLEWITKQGYYRPELIKSGDRAGEVINVFIPKPQSIFSFCDFAGIDYMTFLNYNSGEKQTNNIEIVEASLHVRAKIQDSQIGGAIANVYNANIVSRINNLSEQVESKVEARLAGVKIVIDGDDYSLEK